MKQLLTDITVLEIDNLYFGRFEEAVKSKSRFIERYREATKVYTFLAEKGIYHPEAKFHVSDTEKRLTIIAELPELEMLEKEPDHHEKDMRKLVSRVKRLCKLKETDSDMRQPDHYHTASDNNIYYNSLAVFPIHPEYLKRHNFDPSLHSVNKRPILKK